MASIYTNRTELALNVASFRQTSSPTFIMACPAALGLRSIFVYMGFLNEHSGNNVPVFVACKLRPKHRRLLISKSPQFTLVAYGFPFF
jgi:hypothetical protein